MVKIADGADNSDPRRFGETRSKGGYPFLERSSSGSTNDGKLTPVDLATEQALRQQIGDDLAARQFMLAVDENLRFLTARRYGVTRSL